MQNIHKKHKVWKYKNTSILILSLIIFFSLSNTLFSQYVFRGISELGIIGFFIAGILFVSTFTVVPASFILINLSTSYNSILVAIVAGLGAVIGDYAIFRFLKDAVFTELKPIYNKLGGTEISRLIRTPFFAWMAPVAGAFIIASPIPDEIGISLMGISKLKNWQFVVISFLLNALGIFFIVEIAKLI